MKYDEFKKETLDNAGSIYVRVDDQSVPLASRPEYEQINWVDYWWANRHDGGKGVSQRLE